MSRRRRSRVLLASALLAFPGCLPPEAQKVVDQLGKELDAILVVFTGGQSPLAGKTGAPTGASGPTGPAQAKGDFDSVAARDSKANAELLHEVYKVVLIREPKDRSEFGSLVDSINQGASFEGIYNGFTHSSDYRKLEMVNAGASPDAVKVFGEELAMLEAELPAPTEFDASAAQPLAMPVQPGLDPAPTDEGGKAAGDGVTVVEFGKKAEPAASPTAAAAPAQGHAQPAASPSGDPKPKSEAELRAMAEKYSQVFVGASIYTLKRVLGDEALKVMAYKKEYREKFALWYSKWVVHMAARNVDFGIAQRNQADEAFHYKWALTANPDRLQWEVLNRLHRVLNEANKQKQ